MQSIEELIGEQLRAQEQAEIERKQQLQKQLDERLKRQTPNFNMAPMAAVIEQLGGVGPGVSNQLQAAANAAGQEQAAIDNLNAEIGATKGRGGGNALDQMLKLRGQDMQQELAEKRLAAAGARDGQKDDEYDKVIKRKMAEQTVKWDTEGRSQLSEQSSVVDEAINRMMDPKNKGNISGPKVGAIWEPARKVLYSASTDTQRDMQSAIQSTLRPTLGAQFTEKEGERIMNLAFDPLAGEQENLRRAKLLKDYLDRNIQFRNDYNAHFRKYRTVDNFPFEKYGRVKEGDPRAFKVPAHLRTAGGDNEGEQQVQQQPAARPNPFRRQ